MKEFRNNGSEINVLPNLGVYLGTLNPFVFQQLKKDCENGLKIVEDNVHKRSGDLLEMFHQDIPKEVFFQQPTKSKAGLERELFSICKNLIGQYPEYLYNLNRYENETEEWDLSVERFWINYQRPGEYTPLHRHSGIFSFVVWVQIPYNSTDIISNTQNEAYSLNKGYQGQFEFVYTDMLGQIKTTRLADDSSWEGKICVFPAELYHQVYPFYNNGVRISVSGNVRVKK